MMGLLFGTTLAVFLIISVASMSANAETVITSSNDWVTCGAYIQEAQQLVNESWSVDEIHEICVELIVTGEITIQREDQRDIVIIWASVGDTVKIPL